MDWMPGKLVRSKVPQLLRDSGTGEPQVRPVEGREYAAALRTALQDAVRAYQFRADAEHLAELAEVVEQLQRHHQLSPGELQAARQALTDRYGDYAGQLLLEDVQEPRPRAPELPQTDTLEVVPQLSEAEPEALGEPEVLEVEAQELVPDSQGREGAPEGLDEESEDLQTAEGQTEPPSSGLASGSSA